MEGFTFLKILCSREASMQFLLPPQESVRTPQKTFEILVPRLARIAFPKPLIQGLLLGRKGKPGSRVRS